MSYADMAKDLKAMGVTQPDVDAARARHGLEAETREELDRRAEDRLAVAHEARRTRERNRDLLLQDEREYGVAFTDWQGERVDPNCVFKSVANTYTDSQGRAVKLWKSESA
jgi:hypothetical protein